MATKKSIKKNSSKQTTVQTKKENIVFGNPLISKSKDNIFNSVQYTSQLIFFCVLSFIIYFNTIFNGYVLDDAISITQNKFVQEGISGIGKILSSDSMFGFVGSETELTGGRYRPFPLIIFAIETALFNNNAMIGHLLNIITWTLSILVFFKLMSKYLFRANPEIVFVSTLIFVLHPIHTEVVANIKSRDEIISLLLLLSSMYYLFKSFETNTFKHKIFSYILFFIALLSKEYGVTFLLILPLSLWTFTNIPFKKILQSTMPFIAVFVFYMLIRLSVVGINNNSSQELLNNPFIYASFIEKYSTIMVCLNKYIQLLIYPYPLSYDYRFNQIPIVGLADLKVLFAIAIHLSLLYIAIIKLKTKSLISFIILFYLFSIFIASNMLVEIGALMGERFLYQPSVAYAILLGYVIHLLFQKININTQIKNIIIIAITLIISAPFTAYTWVRNADWKSDIDLYIRDVKSVPNSAPANNSAASSLINLSDFIRTDVDSIIKNENINAKKSLNENLSKVTKFYPNLKPQVEAIKNNVNSKDYSNLDKITEELKNELLKYSTEYCKEAIKIHPQYHDAMVNIVIAYIRMSELDSGEIYLNKLQLLNSQILGIDKARVNQLINYLAAQYHTKGQKFAGNKDLKNAVIFFEKATKVAPDNYKYWYDLGGASYTDRDFIKAFMAWEKAYKINPNAQEVVMGLKALGYQF